MKKVYLLEDDESICDLIECAFNISSIELTVFKTIAQFKEGIRKEIPSVCLLDIMLPDGSGVDVLKHIKTNYPSVICIMLSALGQETDKVKSLNLGADDYITKPFGILELTARVNVQLRRVSDSTLKKGRIILNESKMEASIDDVKLELNNKEFSLLKYLMINEGIVLSRDMILNAVWGYSEGETRTVDNHIARLRKLGIDEIETVFSVGYKFVSRE